MTQSTVRSIKFAQKNTQLFREFSQLFMRLILDEPRLEGIFVSKVELSSDGGAAYIYFYTSDGEEGFRTKLPILILYKPSLRKALSQKIVSRYTPELVFKFDQKFEKISKIEALLDKIKTEEEPS